MEKQNKTKNKFIFSNENIKQNVIRIIGEINPTEEISKNEALKISKSYNSDLILLSITKDDVGICKIIDYSKFLYEIKQKKKEQEKNQKTKSQNTKEIRFGPNTDEHDYEFKKRHAEKFLKNNDIS
jgi:translation initiation factor IF-3